MAVETTKSKKRVDRNVNLRDISSAASFGVTGKGGARRTDKVKTTLVGCRPSCLPEWCHSEEAGEEMGTPGGLRQSTTWGMLTQVAVVTMDLSKSTGHSVQPRPPGSSSPG